MTELSTRGDLKQQLTALLNAPHLTKEHPHPKTMGKARNCFDLGETLLMVATDRLSAFDRAVTTIPGKGQVLTQLSTWWFKQTKDIVPNHFIRCTELNTMEVKKCTVFPIEVVVRRFLTGSTNTAIWTLYQQGQREFFGTTLVEGLQKNTELAVPILTPTTKDSHHDIPLTKDALENGSLLSLEDWQVIQKAALALFNYGVKIADNAGLILVDTKYEFGKDAVGNILLIDECHTPDSSRFWEKSTYKRALKAGKEPKGFDKEAIRLWLTSRAKPYEDKTLPTLPDELRIDLSLRYISLFERLTGQAFKLEA